MKANKAAVAAAVAGLSFAIPVAGDGLTLVDCLGIVLAALVGFQSVYWTTNKPS